MSYINRTDEIISYLREQFPATAGHKPIREKIGGIENDLNQCADALRRLHDAQCGAPIPAPHKYYDDWCKAMADAMVILGKLNK